MDKTNETTTCYECGREITEDEISMSWDNEDCTGSKAVCENCY